LCALIVVAADELAWCVGESVAFFFVFLVFALEEFISEVLPRQKKVILDSKKSTTFNFDQIYLIKY
jgi:hypothetical protein